LGELVEAPLRGPEVVVEARRRTRNVSAIIVPLRVVSDEQRRSLVGDVVEPADLAAEVEVLMIARQAGSTRRM